MALSLLGLLAACGPDAGSTGPQPAAAATATSDRARAEALLRPENPLPSRAETVALADAVAIASAKSGASPEGASLALLAADLRVRLWRIDRAQADAHEAIELYKAAAAAFGPTAEGCGAAFKSALFAGETAQDAAAAYRALFIAERLEIARGSPSACLDGFHTARAAAIAYRPEGTALAALEKEAIAAVAGARAAAPPPVASATGEAGSASPAAPSTLPGPVASGDRDNLIVSPPESTLAKGPAKITSIERYGSEEGARVVLHATAPIGFDVGSLGSDEKNGKDARIYLDLKNASAKGVSKEIEVGGALKRIRLGAQKTGTRVVFDLKGPLYRRIFYLPQPFRIVVDLSTRPPQREEKVATGPGAATGAREVRRVAIDPGHGGVDTGAVGPTGLKEKDVTLDIAHRTAPLLARELKIETLLTRDTDAYVALDLRTARANAFHADLFLSIHCNASESGTARGVQTFYLDASRERDTSLDRIAARENSLGKGKHEGADAADHLELSAIVTNLDVGKMAARSHHFADLMHRSALASLAARYADAKDQGVKSAGFYVLVGADMPAVLFETSFISNSDDEARLATADYRQKMADAIANAIKAYKEGK